MKFILVCSIAVNLMASDGGLTPYSTLFVRYFDTITHAIKYSKEQITPGFQNDCHIIKGKFIEVEK